MKEKKKSILSQSSWWMVNKALTKKIGLDASFLLSDLISKFEDFERKGLLQKEGYFFNDMSKIEEDTGLSPYRQRIAVDILIKNKLISIKKEGLPKRYYYRVHIYEVDRMVYELSNE